MSQRRVIVLKVGVQEELRVSRDGGEADMPCSAPVARPPWEEGASLPSFTGSRQASLLLF